MKPCEDEPKTENGTGMVFNVPSPVTFEYVCQIPLAKSARYWTTCVNPDCDWNENWKFAPLSCGFRESRPASQLPNCP